MKAVAYSIRPFERESLAKANQKKHDITLISNTLTMDTVLYAEGKIAVIVSDKDEVSAQVVDILAGMGVKYITTRSVSTSHIDKEAIFRHGIKLSNVPAWSNLPELLQANADQTINNLDMLQLNQCVGKACISAKGCAAA
jgi:lactate dehydrogenase-like 2-hydroxyacid dehydrogenase